MDEWPKHGLEARSTSDVTVPIRGTQSFVRVMQWCWKHPSVTAIEVLWRWTFGSLALWVLWTQGAKVVSAVTGGRRDLASLGLGQLTITDPLGAASRVATALGLLLPPLLLVARWAVPVLLVAWLLVSTIGRSLVLRRVDPAMRMRPLTLGLLQLVRAVALGASLLLWVVLLRWAGATAVSEPLARGGSPELVLYFAIVIVGTLLMFSLWSIVSWAFSLAPLVAMQRGLGVIASLRVSVERGPIRLKLVEINLVMGIVKIALIVLAMVLSACPLPFQSVMTQDFLVNWTVGVAVLYLLGSDFFHVARMVAYLELWRVYTEPSAGVSEVLPR
jgi:hypothetical protein